MDNETLLRYFADTATRKERRRVEAWTDASPRHAAYAEGLRSIYERGERPERFGFTDPEAAGRVTGDALDRLDARLDRAGARPKEEAPRRRERPPVRPVRRPKRRAGHPASGRRRPAVRRGWPHGRMATALAVVLVAGALLFVGHAQGLLEGLAGNRAAATRTVEAAPGKRVALTLADGTTVKLHPGATLHFPERFESDGRRAVRLDGEAYFDVARDPARPFLVRTSRAHVEVLGTAFNVQAYGDVRPPGDARSVEVTVAEGRVALRPTSPEAPSQTAGQVVLAAGDVGHLAPSGRLYAQREVDVGSRLAWTRGALDFRSAPLRDVAHGMERWYGIEVALDDSARIASRELTATFDDESPAAAAAVVAFLLGVDYKMQGGRLVFRPAPERAAGAAPDRP